MNAFYVAKTYLKTTNYVFTIFSLNK